MKPSPVPCLLSALALLSAVTASACATAAPAGAPRAEEPVAELKDHPALRGIHPELLRITEIPLPVLGIEAVRVEVLDRVPPRELVLSRPGDEWLLSLENKSLDGRWRRVAEALAAGREDSVCSLDAAALAEDFGRLLVDPDPRYGIVLESPESVPTGYRSSDVLRDLERSGLDEAEVRATLLRKVPSGIRPPETTCDGGRARLEFFTWHYFAGEIASWRIEFRPRARVEQRSLASGTGSYDYYY